MMNKVFLKIHDFECSIEDINELLGLSPTKAWMKGDVIEDTKSNKTRKSSLWQIQADVDEEKPIADHVKYMVDLISAKSELLKKLTKKYESEFTVLSKCNEKTEFNYGFYMDKNSLAIISEVGLSIDIDIYFLPKG